MADSLFPSLISLVAPSQWQSPASQLPALLPIQQERRDEEAMF